MTSWHLYWSKVYQEDRIGFRSNIHEHSRGENFINCLRQKIGIFSNETFSAKRKQRRRMHQINDALLKANTRVPVFFFFSSKKLVSDESFRRKIYFCSGRIFGISSSLLSMILWRFYNLRGELWKIFHSRGVRWWTLTRRSPNDEPETRFTPAFRDIKERQGTRRTATRVSVLWTLSAYGVPYRVREMHRRTRSTMNRARIDWQICRSSMRHNW